MNYPYSLNQLTEDQWDYITDNKDRFVESKGNEKLEWCLRFPGFLIDKGKDTEEYRSFYSRNFIVGKIDPPRGNLSSIYSANGCPLILCGIAPGFSELDRNAPKWLLGPSSKLIHKILYVLKIYPYFTNIFKSPFLSNNKNNSANELDSALKILAEEIEILNESFWKDSERIYVLVLGKYKEYQLLPKYVKIDKIKYVSMYHPSYFLRNGIVSVDDPRLREQIEKVRREIQ